MTARPHVAIVGAGIGGITTAVLLQQAGYDCRVYEQAPQFRRVGAGINLAPNSTRVFRAMGILEKLLGVGVQPRMKFNREWDSGRVLQTIATQELTTLYGAPFVGVHRGDLHDVLASAVAPGTFHLGKRFVGLEARKSHVRLAFEDRTSALADAVIGADGLHSRVRAAIIDTAAPVYYGHVAYRSIFPRSLLPDLEIADNTRWLAPDRYLLVYFMSEARNDVYVVTGGPEPWDRDDWSPFAVDPDRLRTAFAGFHADVQRMLDKCESVSRWPMLVRPPSLPWCVGRVALLGDACHATTPHMGQGGGMAVEDAAMLVRCLRHADGDVEPAFRLYESNRFARTSRLKRDSEADEWGHGKIEHRWLYGYEVLRAPIGPAPSETA